MLLPNQLEIQNVTSAINQKYTGEYSDYQVTNLIVNISNNQVVLRCLGEHHVANAYDLGLGLGLDGRFISYDFGDSSKTSSIVTIKEAQVD